MGSDLEISTASNSASNSALIDGIRSHICDRIDRHKEVGRNAANLILDTLENYVRIGWLLLDLRREFRKVPGAYESFVERNLPVGISQADRYAQVARKFERDAENFQELNKLRTEVAGLEPMLIDSSSPTALRQQLLCVGANSFSELQRCAGISKPKLLNGTKKAEKPPFLKLGKSISAAWLRYQRINKVDPVDGWTNEEKRAIRADLEPLVRLYESLS